MMFKECSLIRELLPLYAENLLSEETSAYIKEHLAKCDDCAREWEMFKRPLPDPLPIEKTTLHQNIDQSLFGRLRKTIITVVLLLVVGGAGLVYASYNAGKHIGMDDPSYRFAEELGLFTEIEQTQTLEGIQVTLERGLFDSTRSILFISLSAPFQDMLWVSLSDEDGNQYEQKSGRGWKNKYFMLDFEPLSLETQQVNVSLAMDEQENESVDFSFPVDVMKTAQYTTIIYPNQEKKLSDLNITLDKAVLGVSETEFKLRFDWPVDGSVAGISLGRGMAYFPTSVIKTPDTPPPPGMRVPPPGGLMSGYAATFGINYRPEDPPGNRPALYDLTRRQEAAPEEGEYTTTQFPCQVLAALKFAPVKQEPGQLELLLPPVYIYKKVAGSSEFLLDFKEKNKIDLEQSVSFPQGKVIIEKAWLEKNQVYLSYHLESSADPDIFSPHFELTDTKDAKQGQMRFDRENSRIVIFSLYHEGVKEFCLSLDSIGQLLPREKFTLDLQE